MAIVDRNGEIVSKVIDMQEEKGKQLVWMKEIPGINKEYYALLRGEEGMYLVDFYYGVITKIIECKY